MSKQSKFQPDPTLMGGKTSSQKAPQHSLPASKAIAQEAVQKLGLERQGTRELAQSLDRGVNAIADEDAETLAQLTRSLMPRTMQAYARKMQENPGEGAAISAMFLEGVAAIPSAKSALPSQSASQSLSAGAAAGAIQALPGGTAQD